MPHPPCLHCCRVWGEQNHTERLASALWEGRKPILTRESFSSVVLHSATKHLKVLPWIPLRFMDQMGG